MRFMRWHVLVHTIFIVYCNEFDTKATLPLANAALRSIEKKVPRVRSLRIRSARRLCRLCSLRGPGIG